VLELTVLGCSGSYGAPAGGACSGYLLRGRDATIWLDCGNGSFANLQRHADPAELSAVVVTHSHPDHCVDLYGLHVMERYGLETRGREVYAAEGVYERMSGLVGGQWDDTFDWQMVGDGDAVTVGDLALRFSRTDHPVPTTAVEIASGGKRLVYTSDTGPGWGPDAFGAGADLVLSDATYQHDDRPAPVHLSALQAAELARAAGARRLMITHLWPTIDPARSVAEASEAFGDEVLLAAPHLQLHV
jgi:ribonuclease BN (tRNA processing enzyme)